MATAIAEYYNYIFFEQMDPRVKGWFLMDSPVTIILIVTSYVAFVTRVGPWWMRGRSAYNVEKVMLLYNIVQMTINAYFVCIIVNHHGMFERITGFRTFDIVICYKKFNTTFRGIESIFFVRWALYYIWIPGHYSWVCQRPIYGPNPTEDVVVRNFYIFMCSRLLDLLDTVFMVLKKNKHQVSFLHLYHHVMIALATWLCVKYMPGGHVAFFGTINAFVHVVMYFYYFLTSYDASYKKSIWWKRHITEIQLIQFIVLVGQQGYAMISPSCDYPKYLLIFFLSQAVLMIYLFSNFYFKTYIMKSKAKIT